MKKEKETEFLRELEKAAKDLHLLQYFLENEHLRNGLFEQYANTETKADLRLYYGKYFTETELSNEIAKNNKMISVQTKDSAANFAPVTDFDKKIGEIETEFYDLLKNNNLPKKYYSHSIYETEIFKKLSLIVTDIEDFQKRIIDAKDFDFKDYAESFAKNLIRRIEDLEVPEMTPVILEDFVKNENNAQIDAVYIIASFMRQKESVPENEIRSQFRELKRYADNIINDYLNKLDKTKKTTRTKTLNDFFENVKNKEKFLFDLKETFATEMGIDFSILMHLLKDDNLLFIGHRQFSTFHKLCVSHFNQDIGTKQGVNDKYKHSEEDQKIYKPNIAVISNKLKPLIDRHKAKPQ